MESRESQRGESPFVFSASLSYIASRLLVAGVAPVPGMYLTPRPSRIRTQSSSRCPRLLADGIKVNATHRRFLSLRTIQRLSFKTIERVIQQDRHESLTRRAFPARPLPLFQTLETRRGTPKSMRVFVPLSREACRPLSDKMLQYTKSIYCFCIYLG